jgi:long-chain acyl-CoA synthetase
MNVATWLERNGRSFPERPAIARGTFVHVDFRTWAARAGAIAGALLDALGCQPGECAAIVMRNQPEYLEAKFGIWHAGSLTSSIAGAA